MKNNKKQKKVARSKAFKLGLSIFAGVAAIGATCGLAIGLCSTAETKYIDTNPYRDDANRIDYSSAARAYTSWTANDTEPTESTDVMKSLANSDPESEDFDKRYRFSEVVGNGPDTSILDKSFQQSGYYAQTYWIHSQDAALKGGTHWDWQNPQLNYEDFPLDSLVINNSNTNPVPGEFSSTALKPSGTSNTDFVNTYTAAHDAGKKVIIMPGYQHIGPMNSLKESKPNVYNSMGYILVDTESVGDHIASIQFKAEQSAFLTGIAACQYLEENWEKVYSKVNDGQLAVGSFGGQNINTVVSFLGGLELGVWFYNTFCLPNTEFYKNASKEEKEKRTVKFISLGKEASYFSGTFVIGDAKLLAQELLAKGACCVMAVAGPQTGDVVSEIVAQKSPCRVLGVDSAMENGDWGKYMSTSNLLPENTKVVLCSAEKNIGQLVSQVLDNIWKGNRVTYPVEGVPQRLYAKLDDGNKIEDLNGIVTGTDYKSMLGAVGSIGYTTVGSLFNSGVNLSTAGQDYLWRALRCINNEKWQAIGSYDEAISVLTDLSIKLPTVILDNGVKLENKTVAEIISENHYFIY